MYKVESLDESRNLATGSESISFMVSDGEENSSTHIVSATHINWRPIKQAVEQFNCGETSNEELAQKLLANVNILEKVATKIVNVEGILDGRMTIQGNRIFIDHDPIDPALEAHLLRILREDGTPQDHSNWTSYANFVEKLYANAQEHVRAQLFGWLNAEMTFGGGFTLTPEGDFIGYKGCLLRSNGVATSISTGSAVVNGENYSGHIPNPVGAVVEMPRSQVEFDPSVGCASGLHVGTYKYASEFSRGVILKVAVNPADVVSVPVECSAQKIRTCRYRVLEVTKEKDSRATDTNNYAHNTSEEFDSSNMKETALESSELDGLVAGDVIKFNYTKLSNNRQGSMEYVVQVSNVDKWYVDGLKMPTEAPRTFYRDNINNIVLLEKEKEETSENISHEEENIIEEANETKVDNDFTLRELMEAASVGDRVQLTYNNKTYEGTIHHSSGDLFIVNNNNFPGSMFRSFTKNKITDFVVL